MRFSRPSTGTILGAIALFIALGGTAFAAGATVVNIADPTTPADVAHVNASGQLAVAGPVSVTSTVNTQLAAPSNYFHSSAFDLTEADGCTVIAKPPSGKAVIIRDMKIDVFQDPSPGTDQNIAIFSDTTCTSKVADLNPPTVGETTLPFDPGLGIPHNSGVSVLLDGSVQAEVFTDGYSVSSGTVPAAGASASKTRAPQQQ